MKILKLISKIFAKVICAILILFLMVFTLGNTLKYPFYLEYYKIEDTVCRNPGLNDNFVPQGLAVTNDVILTSGYMSDDNISRIYIINNGNVNYKEVYVNGKASRHHLGGIAISGDNVYLCAGTKLYSTTIDVLLSDDEVVYFTDGYSLLNTPSYTFADDNYLYVGEYNDGSKYVSDNMIEDETGTYYAICTKYALTDLTTPLQVYALPNHVQGFCVTNEGKIVLSISHGFTSSEYQVYTEGLATSTYKDIPLVVLSSYDYVIKGPAMSEDLSYYEGKVYTLTEAACNKYFLGKIFFANKINSLDIK